MTEGAAVKVERNGERYIAKKEDIPELPQKPGRFWGVIGRKNLPLGKREDREVDAVQAVQRRRLIRRYRWANTPPEKRKFLRKSQLWSQEFTAKLFCNMESWLEYLRRAPKYREVTWEALRRSCNDRGLTDADAEIYHTHLRAIFIQLMLVGIAKNCNMNTSSDAHVFVLIWLKERGQPKIQEVVSGYSQAFGGATSDGVMEMVMHFADCVASPSVLVPKPARDCRDVHALFNTAGAPENERGLRNPWLGRLKAQKVFDKNIVLCNIPTSALALISSTRRACWKLSKVCPRRLASLRPEGLSSGLR